MMLKIFIDITIPLFIMIGAGIALDRAFKLDAATLSKLNFYLFVPVLLFVKIVDLELETAAILPIAVFTVVHMAVLFGITLAAFSGPLAGQRTIMSLAAIFTNCGNFGIPLMFLAFGDSGVAFIAIVIIVHNLATFTFGIWLLERRKKTGEHLFVKLLKVPVVYAVIAGAAVHYSGQVLPTAVKVPLDYIADGLVPIALVTLGVELSRSSFTSRLLPLGLSVLLRLAISPLLALVMLTLFDFTKPVADMLIVASALPTGVNVYILAREYNEEPAAVSQVIFWTTLLSAAVLPFILVALR